jgi:hypothetical protein
MEAVRASVNKRTKNIREELDMKIHGTQVDLQAMKTLVEITSREFRMKLAKGFSGVFVIYRDNCTFTHSKLRRNLSALIKGTS